MWLCPYVSRLLILLGNFNQMSVKLLNTVKVAVSFVKSVG